MLATTSAGRTAALLGSGTSTAAALTGGYHLAFWIAAAMLGAAVVVALTVVRPSRQDDGVMPELLTA